MKARVVVELIESRHDRYTEQAQRYARWLNRRSYNGEHISTVLYDACDSGLLWGLSELGLTVDRAAFQTAINEYEPIRAAYNRAYCDMRDHEMLYRYDESYLIDHAPYVESYRSMLETYAAAKTELERAREIAIEAILAALKLLLDSE